MNNTSFKNVSTRRFNEASSSRLRQNLQVSPAALRRTGRPPGLLGRPLILLGPPSHDLGTINGNSCTTKHGKDVRWIAGSRSENVYAYGKFGESQHGYSEQGKQHRVHVTEFNSAVHGMNDVSNDKMDVTDEDGDDEDKNCEDDENEDSGDDEDKDRKVPHGVSSNPLFPSGGRYYLFPTFGCVIPKSIACKFRPTVDMRLSMKQVQVCAYLYYPDNDPSEVLFKVEDSVARREDFDCLCPPNVIQPEIIKMVALKTTWVQQHTPTASVWSLPPSFADDVRQGCTIDALVNAYAKDWMVPYIGLKYIYAPIHIVKGCHWFLLVVSIKDQKVYHIDSRLPVGVVTTHRRGIIRKMC